MLNLFSPLLETGRIGWTLLVIAAVILVGSTLVLARLRWTQSRPIATCVVLSIFAHGLLVCSAYLTRMFDVPAPPGDGGIRVSLSEPSRVQLPAQEVREPRPWERLAVEPPVMHDVSDIELPPLENLDSGPAAISPPPPVARKAKPKATPLPEFTTAMLDEPPPAAITAEPASRDKHDDAPDIAQVAEAPDAASANVATSPHDSAGPQSAPDLPTASDLGWKHITAATDAPPTVPPTPTFTAVPKTPRPLPPRYRDRQAPNREQIVVRRGGSKKTEVAVQRALHWLAANQHPDGRWDASAHGGGQGRLVEGHFRGPAGVNADTGISGLALLALLGAGHTHQEGAYQDAVAKGLEFLMRSQQSDGNLFGDATNFARMYCHGIATLAMGEALAMTDDQRLRPFVERAVRFSIASQHRMTGGWRYHPGDVGDTSQFGWQVMALTTAQQAGVVVPEEVSRGMIRYLQSASQGVYGGLASYRPHHAVSVSMTAEAMVCRAFLHQSSPLATDEATRFIMQSPPGRCQPNFYYWYYATLALSQTDSQAWRAWNHALTSELLGSQRASGPDNGSWDPSTVWGGHGGRVYTTALAAMCLEVYYRYPLTP